MNQNAQNEQLIKIGNWISSRLDKYETIVVLLFIIGFVLKLRTDLKVGFLIILSLSTLAILYFISAYSFIKIEENAGLYEKFEQFLGKLVSMSSSIGTIGILFVIQNWPGYNQMLIIGCSSLIISLLAILILHTKKPDLKLFNQRVIIRIVVIAVIGLALRFTPKEDLIKFGLHKEINMEQTE